MNAKTLGILAVVGIGGYLLYRYQKAKVSAAPAIAPESPAAKAGFTSEEIVRLVEGGYSPAESQAMWDQVLSVAGYGHFF